VTVTAPPRPPRPSDPVTHGEFDALVEAVIEEARQRGRRRRRRNGAIVTLVALVGVTLFALLGGGAQSQTTSRAAPARSSLSAGATSSKIVFLRDRTAGGGWSIWVMNADGSEERQLAGGADSFNPTWSPDGQKIAFQSRHGRQFDVYLMNADGTAKRNLTRHRANDGIPTGRPTGDGSRSSGGEAPARWATSTR